MRMCKKLCDCGVKFGSFSINRVWILCTVIIQTLLVSLILSVCRYCICLFIKGIIRCKKKYKVIYILDLYNNEVVNRAILSVTPWSHHCPTFLKTTFTKLNSYSTKLKHIQTNKTSIWVDFLKKYCGGLSKSCEATVSL